METFYLDTHVAVWLYAGKAELFPPALLDALDSAQLYISPFVLLEIQFLREAGKIQIKTDTFLREMKHALGLEICPSPFVAVTLEATRISWTRDPFDRMIVAQASVNAAPLITRDRVILKHYPAACWEMRNLLL